MVEMDLFLNTNHMHIHSGILYVDSGCNIHRLKAFLDHTALDRLILTGEVTAAQFAQWTEALLQQGIRIPGDFSFCPLAQLQRPEGSVALILEQPRSMERILSLAVLQPDYLVGRLPENGPVQAFALWERFRSISSRIHLTTMREELPPQILDWQRQDGCDTELSVIFPVYNVAKYLDQCIASVTAWQAPYAEFLFVNDGSPDESREIILHWAEKDSRIRLLDKENGGCASARQWGLEHARGRYVGFVDPDDFVDEAMFPRLLSAALTGSYEISYCGYQEYYETTGQTRAVPDVLGDPYDKGVSDIRQIQQLIAFCGVAIWRGIYKMEMLRRENIRFCTQLRRFDDLPFKVETFGAARSVIAVNDHLYYYRLARPGQDTAADDERLYVHFPIFAHLNDRVASRLDPRLTDCLQICKIQTHRYALEKLRRELIPAYLRQARADLASTGYFRRTLRLVREMAGRKSALYYLAIMTCQAGLVRLLRKQ